jgi:hypothetical protein
MFSLPELLFLSLPPSLQTYSVTEPVFKVRFCKGLGNIQIITFEFFANFNRALLMLLLPPAELSFRCIAQL